MNIWLCPVKPKSFRIIKTLKVFGLPKNKANLAKQIKKYDLIIFHVLKPINGIVAVCEVTSEVYEDYENIWGKMKYPLRLKVRFIPELTIHEKESIPLSCLFYTVYGSDNVIIEPYIKGTYITPITSEQFEKLKALIKQKSLGQKN
ncbi:MAG: EVE domain-containing protein [Candidatus Bathyarchaeia archaeon]